MSDLNNIQFINEAQLKQIMLANADKADKRYVKKSEFNTDNFAKVEDLGALANKDEVGIDDLSEVVVATIDAKANAAEVYTSAETDAAIADAIDDLGALASLDKVSADDLSDGVKNRIEDTYTKSEVYTKEDVYTKDEVDAAVRTQVASIYKPAGSATVDTLPEPSAAVLGFVFNISEDGYTTEDFVEGADKKIVAGTNVVVVYSNEEYKFDVFAGELDLSGYVKEEDINVATSAQIQSIIDSIYAGSDLNPEPEVVDMVLSSNTSLGEISRAFADPAVTEVNAKLNGDIEVPSREDGKISTTMVNAGQTVNLDLNGHNINCEAYALYVNGGTVNITGEGEITTRIEDKTYPAIYIADGGVCNMSGGVLDCTAEASEGHNNWVYGAVCSGSGVFNMTGGEIKTYDASCVSICNGTASGEGAQFFIGGDAHLTTEIGPAVYLADNKDLVIKDDAVLEGGITARMGNIVIKDNAQVINNLDNCDGFGMYLTKSGTAATPNGVCLLTGCYKTNTESNECSLTISDNAKVESVLGEAVGVYKMDTLYDQDVNVTVEDSANLTSADGFDKVKVFSHDECAALVEADGATMAPAAKTTKVVVTVDGNVVYDDTPAPEPEPEEP